MGFDRDERARLRREAEQEIANILVRLQGVLGQHHRIENVFFTKHLARPHSVRIDIEDLPR